MVMKMFDNRMRRAWLRASISVQDTMTSRNPGSRVNDYEYAHDNQYSEAVREFSSKSQFVCLAVDIPSIISDQLQAQLTCIADVKKNRKGLKAVQEIPAGQTITEYEGKIMLRCRHDYDREHVIVNSFKKSSSKDNSVKRKRQS